jgi:hypothetical protein
LTSRPTELAAYCDIIYSCSEAYSQRNVESMAPLLLCGGLQSSGSTLVSWCFLQRKDVDGVLDARFDMVPSMPAVKGLAWCKFTIATFRFKEIKSLFEDDGWNVTPLLVVRDVRSVFNSLIKKSYGRNGTTAEDPPIRVRLRRFLEDWQLFRSNNWPMLRFESLVTDGETVLRTACEQMGLAWEGAMIHWQKDLSQIAAASYGNETFLQNQKRSLAESVDPRKMKISTENIPTADLEWMESEFAEFNRIMEYPEHIPATQLESAARAIPDFKNTRRYERIARKHPLTRFYRKLAGSPLLNAKEIAVATGIPAKDGVL